MFFLVLISFFIDPIKRFSIPILLVLLIVALVRIISIKSFEYLYKFYIRPVLLAFLSHIFYLGSFLFILLAFGVNVNILEYMFIFSIAIQVTLHPISISGVGVRELLFLFGATLFSLNPVTAIATSVCYYFIMVSIGLGGYLYAVSAPLLSTGYDKKSEYKKGVKDTLFEANLTNA